MAEKNVIRRYPSYLFSHKVPDLVSFVEAGDPPLSVDSANHIQNRMTL